MTTGLRERKKRATRDALHEAALRLTAERGLDRVVVDDIADRAGVSPRTFFNYFSSKDEAVLGLDPDGHRRQAQALRARPATEPPVESMRRITRGQAETMAADPELWPLRLRVVHTNPLLAARLAASFAESEQALADAIAERSGTSADLDAYPMLLASVAAAVMRTAMHLWRGSGFADSLPDLVDQVWDGLAHGLPDPKH